MVNRVEVAVVCVVVVLLFGADTARGQAYEIFQLDPPSTNFGNFSSATAINNLGVVSGAGSAQFTTDIMCIWEPGAAYPDQIYFHGYNRTTPRGINDLGDYLGTGPKPDGTHGFFNGIDLGLGSTEGMNNLGQVVGWTYDSLYIYHNGVFDYLPTSYWGSEALAINDSGVAVGYWYTDCTQDCYGEACIFRNDSLILLGTLGGIEAQANDINNKGVIVGWSCVDLDCTAWRGFFWEDGLMYELPAFGGRGSEALAINEFGVIVGQAYDAANQQQAFVYDTIVGMRKLADLIPAGSGWDQLYFASDINEKGQIVGYGKIGGLGRAFVMNPVPALRIVDTTQTPLAGITVAIAKVDHTGSDFLETPLGEFTTNSGGLIPLSQLPLATGDTIRVSKLLHSQPFSKHLAHLGTMYSVGIDNKHLNATGNIRFDRVDSVAEQIITLQHTTVSFNLVASVEWDAELSYIAGLQNGFRHASNYLYDVTDGQARFDTIVILDNKDLWGEADIRIHASNIEWPRANPGGIKYAGWHLFMPRDFFGNRPSNIQGSFDENPLLPNSAIFARTLAHEFGHFGLGFRDEYHFAEGTVRCAATPIYGFMDNQYPGPHPYTSEMSTADRYAGADCQNSDQWTTHGTSCWGLFEVNFEGTYSADAIFAPISKPDERVLAAGNDYLPGPNNDSTNWTFDVGALIDFPIAHTAPDAATRIITCSSPGTPTTPLGGVDIWVVRPDGANLFVLPQGQTAANGKIRALGVRPGDSFYTFVGASIGVGKSARQPLAYEWWFAPVQSVDDSEVVLQPVAGEYPLVFGADYSNGVTSIAASFLNPFAALPQLQVFGEDSTMGPFIAAASPDQYQFALGAFDGTGGIVVTAPDEPATEFPINLLYSIVRIDSTTGEIFSGDGSLGLAFDSVTAEDSLLLLSSPYPIIPNGLDISVQQAGQAHAITGATSPALNARLTIRYSDDELLVAADEEWLRIFRWDESARVWNLLGGQVDTAFNEVSSAISEAGTYAAFTVASSTGIGDDDPGQSLPSSFELGQNYPNPFNPSTVIEYSLTARADVTLAVYNVLGQKLTTLHKGSQAAGTYRLTWDGTSADGSVAASGVYLYRLEVNGVVQTRKMLLLR